jgi:hypothetical protein
MQKLQKIARIGNMARGILEEKETSKKKREIV